MTFRRSLTAIMIVVPMNKSMAHKRFRAVLILVAVTLTMSLVIAALPASAWPHPKTVRGYVKDSVERPLEGAYVTVNIRYASNNTTRATDSYTTGSDGWYSVSFSSGQWDEGDIIEAISDLDGKQYSAYDVANVQSVPDIQQVDITYPYEIPEFGDSWSGLSVGFLVAGFALGLIAAVFLIARRKA
ncbi:MAG: hypothetical protein A3K67_03160 [Euryarchaeota archaeon RBG_16_62_10]|nr:MAG: hypothetical protein A3K67_03160 [Euryarchaeota archaeon RBG_16_62_10]